MERFFHGALAAGLVEDDRWEWEGKFGNATCPVCRQRNFMYWTGDGWDFRFGCRELCDRTEILRGLGLTSSDLLPVRPKWLREV